MRFAPGMLATSLSIVRASQGKRSDQLQNQQADRDDVFTGWRRRCVGVQRCERDRAPSVRCGRVCAAGLRATALLNRLHRVSLRNQVLQRFLVDRFFRVLFELLLCDRLVGGLRLLEGCRLGRVRRDNGAPLSSSSFFSVSAVSGCSVGVTNGGTVSPPDGGWLRSGAVADGLILASLSNARSAKVLTHASISDLMASPGRTL